MNTPRDFHVDRSTADRIIQRALELDAERADSLTEAQIREIAAELSVSTASVDQALAEQRASRNEAAPTPAIRPPVVRWFSRASTVVSTIVVVTLIAAVVSRLFP